MWIFFNPRKPEVRLALVAGKTYKIGIVAGHIPDLKGDTSISRNHAQIVVEDGPETEGDRPSVGISDSGSTYGTYVGEKAIASSSAGNSQVDRVQKGEVVPLSHGTRVRIGLHDTIFRLEWKDPMVVTTSSMAKPEFDLLSKTLRQSSGGGEGFHLGRVTSQWSDHITHLVCQEVKLTIKAANALAKGVPIVTPLFFEDFATNMGSQQVLPDPKDYIPPLAEGVFNRNEVDLSVNKSRRTLFKGKLFVFSSPDQMAKFGVAIGYAGGRAIVSEPNSAPEPSAFKLPVNILIEPPSIASQLPVMDEAYKHWKKCEKEALSANLHTIQDLQIGKAILTTNFGNYCDPSVEPVKLFNRSKTTLTSSQLSLTSQNQGEPSSKRVAGPIVLAQETQANKTQTSAKISQTSTTTGVFVIPETLPSTARSTRSRSQNTVTGSLSDTVASDVKQEEEPERSQGKVDKNKKTKEVPEKRPQPGNTQAVDKTFDQGGFTDHSTPAFPLTSPAKPEAADLSLKASQSMKVKENHQMDEEDDDIFTFERSPSPPPAPSVVKNKSDTSLAGTFKPSKGKRPMREPDSDDEDFQAATPSNKRSKLDDAPKHHKTTVTSIPSTSDNGSGVNKTKEHNLAEVDGQKLAKRSKPSEINKAHASGQEVKSQQTAGGRVKRRRSSSTGVEDEDQEDVIDASTAAPSIVKKARRNSSPEAKTETSTQEAFSINKFGFISKNCSYKATGASTIKSEESSSNNNVKIEWSVADLTRSYAHLEVKSLIRPRNNTQSQPANTTNSTVNRSNGGAVNFKKFRKQQLGGVSQRVSVAFFGSQTRNGDPRKREETGDEGPSNMGGDGDQEIAQPSDSSRAVMQRFLANGSRDRVPRYGNSGGQDNIGNDGEEDEDGSPFDFESGERGLRANGRVANNRLEEADEDLFGFESSQQSIHGVEGRGRR